MPFIPCLSVSDTKDTIAFYSKLGFDIDSSTSHPGDDIHMLIYAGELCGMIYSNDDLKNWLPCLKDQAIGFAGMFYLAVENFHETYKHMSEIAEVVKPLSMDHNGQAMFYIQDINGYIIGVNDKAALMASEIGQQYALRK